MSITEVVQALGSWDLSLRADTPRSVLDGLGWFGHVVFLPGRVNPVEHGDNLLSAARYVGVLRGRGKGDGHKLSGCSMAYWLGDEDDKGDVLETAVTITAQAFPAAIRALLPAGGAVVEGTLSGAVAGTYTGVHQWETPRTAITYVCDTMSTQSVPVEWRVTGVGALDAGPVSVLYRATPQAILRRRPGGRDLSTVALPGSMAMDTDIEDWTARVVLLAEGDGAAIYCGEADNPVIPYVDIHGNQIKATRLVSESETTAGNSTSRAQLALSQFLGTRQAVQLSTSAYDVRGDLVPGDYVWVYDPDAGFTDTGNEVMWEGQALSPAKLRCVEMTWPVPAGWTVAYRAGDGTWLDMSDWYEPESGDTTVVVGEFSRSLTAQSLQEVGTRPSADRSVPAAPVLGAFASGSYQSGTTKDTRAQVQVTWTEPLNTDGTAIVDGSHYEIQYRQSGAGADWSTVFVPWGVESALLTDLTPGVAYTVRMRAVDCATPPNSGDLCTEAEVVAAQDSIAPSTPAAPTVAASRIAVQVTHSLGKATGGAFNLELDLDHFEVHAGTTSGFTPSSATLLDRLTANAALITAGIPAVGTFQVDSTAAVYVKVIAVDGTGNKSAASAAASATALLIDDAHISDLTVTKVTAGTLQAAVILSGSISTSASGQRVAITSAGVNAYNSSGTQTVQISSTGTFFLRSSDSGARVTFDSTGINTYNANSVNTVNISSAGSFTLQSAASGARCVLDGTGLNLYNGSSVNTVSLSNAGTFTLRTNTTGARMVIDAGGIEAYNASGTQTFDLDASTGNVIINGVFKTSPSNERVEIIDDATVGERPTIFMVAEGADDYTKAGFMNGYPMVPTGSSSGTTAGVGINSGLYTLSGQTYRGRLILGESIRLEYVDSSQSHRHGLIIGDDTSTLLTSAATKNVQITGSEHVFVTSTNGGTYITAALGISLTSAGSLRFIGSFLDNGTTLPDANEGLFAGNTQSGSGVTSLSQSYGVTMATMPIPAITVYDNIVHTYACTAATTTGFTVTLGQASDGTFRALWIAGRI